MRRSVAVLLVVAFASVANAANITYQIAGPILAGSVFTVSLTGSITTDGTIGALSASDILSWSYTATGGAGPYVESSSDPGSSIFDNGLIATADSLSLPFVPAPPSYPQTTGSSFELISPIPGEGSSIYLAFSTTAAWSPPQFGPSVLTYSADTTLFDGGRDFGYSSSMVFGSTLPTDPYRITPGPATLVLLGSTLLLLAAVRYRRIVRR